jgi:hypothetical protein
MFMVFLALQKTIELSWRQEKNFDMHVHVQVFNVAIILNGETINEEIMNKFKFTFRDNVFNWCNNYMHDYPNCKFANL